MNYVARTALVGVIVLAVAAGCKQTTTIEGQGGRQLKLTRPSSLTIKQGESSNVTVSITRENFTDAVEVKFDNLPKGVTVTDKRTEIASNTDKATFTFHAADDAAVVSNHEASLTVTAPGDLKRTETFNITVNKKT